MSDKNFLLAILLVTSSSKGHSIVFRWPSQPQPARRLSRPLPREESLPDYSWRASHFPQNIDQDLVDQGRRITDAEEDGLAYEWTRPIFDSVSPSSSRPSSGRSSPTALGSASFEFDQSAALEVTDEYDSFLGYSASTLASSLLRADRSVANRKFELQLDELLFIGHPMHVGEDNTWQWDSLYAGGGHRGSKRQQKEVEDDLTDMPSFQGFHLVLVLDRPEICRAGASNLLKYLDVYYQEVALKLTAGLHYEQARAGYVEKQADLLMKVKESCSNNGDSFEHYEAKALSVSNLAVAIKTTYECIASSTIAHIVINNFRLDVQLPPYHYSLLSGDAPDDDLLEPDEEIWDPRFGPLWRVPKLVPWKTLLLMDPPQDLEIAVPLEDGETEDMTKFRSMVSPTLSFADIAVLLDWDLERDVFPMARLLIYLRKAKVIDVIHPRLKTIYAPPAKFAKPLATLADVFAQAFPPTTPSLYTLLSAISSSQHSFSSIVPSNDHLAHYQQILVWMLKNDVLNMLHVRIRIVVGEDVKRRVYEETVAKIAAREDQEREKRRAKVEKRKERRRGSSSGTEGMVVTFVAPTDGSYQPSSPELVRPIRQWSTSALESDSGEDDDWNEDEEDDEEDLILDPDFTPNIIHEPGRTTPLERKWLEYMTQGKEPPIVQRFELVHKYFDGKTTADEIQYRCEVSRTQLREVLYAFDRHLISFLHA